MSQQLISHSPDLSRLRDVGYEIEVCGGYLITHHIPYVNARCEIAYGKLITALNLNGNTTARPPDHVIQFMGEHPCHKDGSIITQIQHAAQNTKLFDGIVMNFSFSNKPKNGYPDYYEKVNTYAELIASPARSIDPSVTAKTFKAIPAKDEQSVFNYIDTNATRAHILQANAKFTGQKIGVIGAGGTGAYILDMLAKTPVAEIHLFDGDVFHQHNAFRCPGAPPLSLFDDQPKKVSYLKNIYGNMHRGIHTHDVFITKDNLHLLGTLSFVFLCVDSNRVRGLIIAYLMENKIPFIDVGLGVNLVEDQLIGTLRATLITPEQHDHLDKRIGKSDTDDNEYATNIQIADLNALNAMLAIIKWKKWTGFYQDLKEEHHSTYSINTSQLIHEDFTA
ncbi:MAG: ThiF family adenylyltransferase [Chitinophagaceae bacterium]